MPLFSLTSVTLLLTLAACGAGGGEEASSAADGDAAAQGEAAARAELAPPPEPLDTATAWVRSTMEALSLRERVGQMVMAWSAGGPAAPGTTEFDRLARWVEREAVGGVIITTGTPESYASRINALQERARVPLLFTTDMESGPGMRLRGDATDFPPVMALGAAGSDSLAYAVGRVVGETGRAAGLGMNLAPVLDVNSNPDNPIINTRAFSGDPALAARLGAAYTRGMQDAGLPAVAKHFPGHGDTHVDSHVELPTIQGGRARLDTLELPPFRAAVQAGVAGMLVGHIAVPALTGSEEVPASVSPVVVDSLLRGAMGFRGLVYTDAMNMGGLTRRYSQAEAAVLSVEAGADVLLQPPDPALAIRAIVDAVQSGRLSAERIDASARRVLAAKERAGLAGGARVDRARLAAVLGSAEHRRLAREVAERSLVLVRDRDGRVPFTGVRRVLLVSYAESSWAARTVEAELRAAGVEVRSATVGPRTGEAELNALARRAGGVDLVLVAANVQPREGRGTVAARGGFPAFVERLAGGSTPVVAVSFGSPYLLQSFPSVGTYLAAWGGDAVSQRAAARALLGRMPITGKLPVGIPPEHPVGTGIVRQAAEATR